MDDAFERAVEAVRLRTGLDRSTCEAVAQAVISAINAPVHVVEDTGALSSGGVTAGGYAYDEANLGALDKGITPHNGGRVKSLTSADEVKSN